MGFFSKLFGKKKKTSNIPKDEELKEETRIISTSQEFENEVKILEESPAISTYTIDVANNVLSKLLLQAITAGELKNYNNIKKFIDKYPPYSDYFVDNREIDFPETEDIKKLAKTWFMLGYKCTNQRLTSIMLKMK